MPYNDLKTEAYILTVEDIYENAESIATCLADGQSSVSVTWHNHIICYSDDPVVYNCRPGDSTIAIISVVGFVALSTAIILTVLRKRN